eukprot:262723-Alexandrium_andersonii.AAC.1
MTSASDHITRPRRQRILLHTQGHSLHVHWTICFALEGRGALARRCSCFGLGTCGASTLRPGSQHHAAALPCQLALRVGGALWALAWPSLAAARRLGLGVCDAVL